MVNTRDNQYRLILSEHVGLGYMYMSETVCTEDVNANAVKNTRQKNTMPILIFDGAVEKIKRILCQ